MKEIFLNILEASFYGGIVIAMVLVLRLVLKKAPRWTICLLWLLAGLRLLFPFEIESSFSLQPREQFVAQIQLQQPENSGLTISQDAAADQNVQPAPQQPPVENTPAVNTPAPQRPQAAVSPEISWSEIVPWVWAAGAGAMGLYSAFSYLQLKRRVREAVKLADNVYECAGLDTAFVLGYLWPRIYIPMGMENPKYIVDHERAHIRRGDHWFKLLMFAALAVHWFNPLVWTGYILLCRDLEIACDERVVRYMSLEQRKAYSATLLACSASHRSFAACPVAFGEVSVKARILSVLNYRKPRFWICLIAIIAIVFVAVCFLTNPAAPEENPESTTESQSSSAAPLDKCKSALEAFQNSEGYYVTVDWQHEGSLSLNETAYAEFWKSGNDWLHVTWIEDSNEYRASMEVGGIQYESTGMGAGSSDTQPQFAWREAFLTEDQYKCWLSTFDFDAQEVVFLEHQAAMGEEMISFSVITGQENGLDVGYTVDFYLDGGVLERAVRTVTKTSESNDEFLATRSTGTMTIVSTDPEQADAAIEAQRQRILALQLETEQETLQDKQNEYILNRCRTALEALQNRKTFHLTDQLVMEWAFDGQDVYDESTTLLYRSGDDWVQCDEDDGYSWVLQRWYMFKEGDFYFREVTIPHDPASSSASDSGWDHVPEMYFEPWILRFDWDSSEIFLSDASDADTVTVTVQVPPNEAAYWAGAEQYTLTFRFVPGTDTIESIVLQCSVPWPSIENGGETESVRNFTETIYPREMAAEDVAAFIDRCYQEAAA